MSQSKRHLQSWSYSEPDQVLTLHFATGKAMKVRGLTREQAAVFVTKHGEQFAQRNGCLVTPDYLTRGSP